MLLTEFLKNGVASLASLYPEAEARSIVLMLCESMIGTRNYTHIVEPEYQIDKKDEAPLAAALERLCTGEPIQYVLGKADFFGRVFHVTPDVLIPRPETELMVREAVKLADMIRRMRSPFGKSATPVRVLDLCTGSGCIAWSVALSVPGARVVGVDISDAALEVARTQPFTQELKETGAIAPTFVKADVLDTEQAFDYDSFDLIFSNPPYVKEEEKAEMRRNVLDFEPAQALFVPDDDPLLFYRAVARWSDRFLAPDGKGLTEINETLGKETAEVFRDSGFSKVETQGDFPDKNRYIFYTR